MKLANKCSYEKSCHSRTSLSGIYNACRCQIKGISLLNRCVEDPRQKPSGMTSNFKEEALNKGSFRAPLRSGFTLIELLVVVLIIGILAAVALPQYQKAVLKSRAVQAFTLGKYLQEQEELYYLAHGAYTNNFNELGAEIPQGFSLDATGTELSFPNGTGSFTLLENYNRILFLNYRPKYTLSFILDTSDSSAKFMCTAYQDDNYKAKALCQSLSGQHTAGSSSCGGTCTSWYF